MKLMPVDLNRKFTRVAIIIPKIAIEKNFPYDIRFDFVFEPYIAMHRNIPAEIAKIFAIEVMLYTKKIVDRLKPFKIE